MYAVYEPHIWAGWMSSFLAEALLWDSNIIVKFWINCILIYFCKLLLRPNVYFVYILSGHVRYMAFSPYLSIGLYGHMSKNARMKFLGDFPFHKKTSTQKVVMLITQNVTLHNIRIWKIVYSVACYSCYNNTVHFIWKELGVYTRSMETIYVSNIYP